MYPAEDRLKQWHHSQSRIAQCMECCQKWPGDVVCPLGVSEIPDPPDVVKVLFIGVAPTRQGGTNNGTHFYSSDHDNLRAGLFSVLAMAPFDLPLTELFWKDAIKRFHDANCFFLHAAKVRPVLKDAPPAYAIAFCARRHLLDEIQIIQPRTVCILSKTKVGPLTEQIFGTPLFEDPQLLSIGTWTGLAAVAPQPVRAQASNTRAVLSKLW